MSRLCQTRQSISGTSLSSSCLHCLPLLITVAPSVARSIFHFSFNFSRCRLNSPPTTSPPLSLSPLSRPVSLLCPPPPSLSREINMPRHVVSTRRSSYGPYQRVNPLHSCSYGRCKPVVRTILERKNKHPIWSNPVGAQQIQRKGFTETKAFWVFFCV